MHTNQDSTRPANTESNTSQRLCESSSWVHTARVLGIAGEEKMENMPPELREQMKATARYGESARIYEERPQPDEMMVESSPKPAAEKRHHGGRLVA